MATVRIVAFEPTDADLVLRAQAGDRSAFAELHERSCRLVHAVVLSRVPPSEAEDLVQEVFLTALDRLGSLKQPSRFCPWISQIARNKATDSQRRRRKLVELPDTLHAPRRPTAEAAEVLAHLQALPETYRETLILRLVEGLTGPEIAEQTGMTPGSVRVNLHRGMKMLRERLGDS